MYTLISSCTCTHHNIHIIYARVHTHTHVPDSDGSTVLVLCGEHSLFVLSLQQQQHGEKGDDHPSLAHSMSGIIRRGAALSLPPSRPPSLPPSHPLPLGSSGGLDWPLVRWRRAEEGGEGGQEGGRMVVVGKEGEEEVEG